MPLVNAGTVHPRVRSGLAEDVLQRWLSLVQLTAILQGVIARRVSIADVERILVTLSQVGAEERRPEVLVDRLCAVLRRA
ncbi:MAG: hypothetical protein HY904_18980 [Deltaproteobacteria bacterium]|nr:hypothetical protein [Deltaproteobacteria bacterium]